MQPGDRIKIEGMGDSYYEGRKGVIVSIDRPDPPLTQYYRVKMDRGEVIGVDPAMLTKGE